MKRLFGLTVALAISAAFLSCAQAAIKIEIAEVQNGFAYIKGNGAQLGAQITWDGNSVTTETVGFRLTVPHRRTALAS